MFDGFVEFLIFILVASLVLLLPLTAMILAVIALARTRHLGHLEARVHQLEARPPAAAPPAAAEPAGVPGGEARVEPTVDDVTAPAAAPAPRRPFQWELLIGQKVLGWLAVVLATFAVAFFLRFAYANNWIGPVGRVAIGVLAGSILLVSGYRHHCGNWRAFSQMLSAAAVVVLYLATYSSFGFYRLLPTYQAGGFLVVVVVLSMLVALAYDALAVGLMAVLGGLLTPLLLVSEQDRYVALFTYLVALNAGVALVTLRRPWPILATLALVGTQALYWLWHVENYHPEKFAWALGFQAIIYVLYLFQDVAAQFGQVRGNRGETCLRMLLNAAFWFGGFYLLLRYDYRAWLGTSAVLMATLYAVVARLLLARRLASTMELVTALAIATGFVVLAIPLEADARWVALAWSATALALWWFGLQAGLRPLLPVAMAIMVVSLLRMLAVDLPSYRYEFMFPFANRIALPAAGTVACLLVGVIITRPQVASPRPAWRRGVLALSGLAGVVLLWLVWTLDLYHFFHWLARTQPGGYELWGRRGQLAVTLLWTGYAALLLAVGFRARVPLLRWTSIAFFAVTVGKLFVVDTRGLSELYRIIAFLALAVFLGVAARVYQRIRWNVTTATEEIDRDRPAS